MSILVTGGAGYIGSPTFVELMNAGYDVVLLDNFINTRPEVVQRIREITQKDFPVYQADVSDESALDTVFSQQEINAVIHFAGFKDIGESVRNPMAYYNNNVGGTLSLCKAMIRASCKVLVFSSSATVYGDISFVPFQEDSPVSATNPYGMTKLIIERILTDIAASDPGWNIVLLRYFNPIGAHPSGLIGDNLRGIPNNLVPNIAQVATGRLDFLRVFGNNYDTIDGTCVRDYVHIVDLALGHLRALAYCNIHSGSCAINLGTGYGHSVFEVVHAFERACGKAIKYQIVDRRPGDIAISYADVTKARILLEWKAERTLDQMCKDMWNYTLKNMRNIM